jgi:hypothetical protein
LGHEISIIKSPNLACTQEDRDTQRQESLEAGYQMGLDFSMERALGRCQEQK